jgi:hypothetical protein
MRDSDGDGDGGGDGYGEGAQHHFGEHITAV